MPIPASLRQLVVSGAVLALAVGCASSADSDQGRESSIHGATGGITQPSSYESARLLSEKFTEIEDVGAIPPACKAAFAKVTGESSFALANPGTPYQSTDVVTTGAKLPWRRLIYGGLSSDRCVLYYEIGGFTTTYAVVVFDISAPGSAKWIWGGVDGFEVTSFQSLLLQIGRGTFRQNGGRY